MEIWFAGNETKESIRTAKAMGGVHPHEAATWILNEFKSLKSLPFSEFVKKMEEEFCDPEWEYELRQSVRTRTQKGSESFQDFAATLRIDNSILSAAKRFDNNYLKDILEAGMSKRLHLHVRAGVTPPDESFNAYIGRVKLLEHKLYLDSQLQLQELRRHVKVSTKPSVSMVSSKSTPAHNSS
ncbi:MAG: hypothetical protein ACREHG_06740, partial [Candidatus Saccharimonadales bacterium]